MPTFRFNWSKTNSKCVLVGWRMHTSHYIVFWNKPTEQKLTFWNTFLVLYHGISWTNGLRCSDEPGTACALPWEATPTLLTLFGSIPPLQNPALSAELLPSANQSRGMPACAFYFYSPFFWHPSVSTRHGEKQQRYGRDAEGGGLK